jgi:hypothetical protein
LVDTQMGNFQNTSVDHHRKYTTDHQAIPTHHLM